MDKFQTMFEAKLMPLIDKMNRNKMIIALRNGMIRSLPFVLFGAFAMIIANFPYLDKFLPNAVEPLQTFFNHASTISMGMLALPVLIGVSSSYGGQYKVDKIYSVLVAFLSFLMLADFSMATDVEVSKNVTKSVTVLDVIPKDVFGSKAIFTAIIVSLVSVYMYQWIVNKKITIKMPESVPPNVTDSFTALIPVCIVLFTFLIIKNLFLLTPFGTFQEMIYQVITAPLLKVGNNIFAYLFLVVIQQILWFFGLHGTSIVNVVLRPIQDTMMAANAAAFQAGKALPYILSTPFAWTYGTAGAQGILPAVIAAVIICKSRQAKAINKLSLPVALFNIQEPFHFAFPTFMNPILLFPYVFCTIFQLLLAYVLCVLNIAPVPVSLVPWTTPTIISGFLATGSIMGSVTQLLQLILGILIWIPFMRIQDKKYLESELILDDSAPEEKKTVAKND